MLYSYKSISPHKIESLNNFLVNFFESLFDDQQPHTTYEDCMNEELTNLCGHYPEQIGERLELIFQSYEALDDPGKKQFAKEAFERNGDIEGICNLTTDPVKYSELEAETSRGFKDAVEELYNSLWGENKTLGYLEVREYGGSVKEHFTDFLNENLNGVCPFCGINSLHCKSDDGRDDYDHYLHKSKYPFLSVDFSNLFPMCHDCNSKRKGQKDAPYDKDTGARRPLFYPFGQFPHHKITFTIDSPSVVLKDNDQWSIEIFCEPNAHSDRKRSWDSIFNISTRYKANLIDRGHWHREILYQTYLSKKKKAHFDWEEFKDDMLREFKSDGMVEKAIIWRTYREFILNQTNFEKLAQGEIT